jgi:hypothetical protein
MAKACVISAVSRKCLGFQSGKAAAARSCHGAVEVAAFVAQTIEQRQRVDAVEAAAAFIEQARADQLVLHGRLREDALGLLLEFRVHLARESVGLEQAADAFEVPGVGDEARVHFVQRGERLLRLRGEARGGGQKGDDEAGHEALF